MDDDPEGQRQDRSKTTLNMTTKDPQTQGDDYKVDLSVELGGRNATGRGSVRQFATMLTVWLGGTVLPYWFVW